jgi:hypothetical protein
VASLVLNKLRPRHLDLETSLIYQVINYWRNKAAFETKRKARPDYYSILNVSSLATEREIKAGKWRRRPTSRRSIVKTPKGGREVEPFKCG